MACETLPCMSYMALYIFSVHVLNTNSRASTHWKLDPHVNRVIQVSGSDAELLDVEEEPVHVKAADINTSQGGSETHLYGINQAAADGASSHDNLSGDESPFDAVLSVLTAPMRVDEDGVWVIRTKQVCSNCDKPYGTLHSISDNTHSDSNGNNVKSTGKAISKTKSTASNTKGSGKSNGNKKSGGASKPASSSSSGTGAAMLDCGKMVNYTYLDHLPGVSNRHNHPRIPEPEVGVVFNMKTMRTGEIDILQLEQTLRKQKKQRPKSANVYNQIGNLLRIKGETRKSIECYRKAIYLSPGDSEAILNLARVLFNLQYLDDAIYLVKRSLELQPVGEDTWLHYFTLGEILKAYGHYQDAIMHFKHALHLNPTFHLAEVQLKELESWSESTVTVYTLLIIIFLVLTVLFFILSSVEGGSEGSDILKPQRHFSRAMAMKSIKGHGSGPRSGRVKKNHS